MRHAGDYFLVSGVLVSGNGLRGIWAKILKTKDPAMVAE